MHLLKNKNKLMIWTSQESSRLQVSQAPPFCHYVYVFITFRTTDCILWMGNLCNISMVSVSPTMQILEYYLNTICWTHWLKLWVFLFSGQHKCHVYHFCTIVSYQSRHTPLKNACNGWAHGGSTKTCWSRRGCTRRNIQHLYTRLGEYLKKKEK